MSKAPKAKKAALHYQPYQALGTGEGDEPSMDLGMADLPLHLDPVLSGLSSNMSRNLWDDWNENDANFGMKFDVFTDEVSTASTASSTASPNPSMHVSGLNASTGYEQQQNASPNTMHTHIHGATQEDPQKPRANVQRSLSEDIVNMLDDSNESTFSKQLDGDQRGNAAMQNMINPSAHRRLSNPSNPSTLDIAVAEGAASLTANAHISAPVTPATSSTSTPSAPQHAISSNNAKEKLVAPASTSGVTSGDKTNGAPAAPNNSDTNMNDPSQQANGFGPQGMMMNPFLMYSMMGPQAMNMMGMQMQMPMGMNAMNGANNGMNGANAVNDGSDGSDERNGLEWMQMPMGLPGMSMGMNMQMPLNMNMQQQVNPQSGQTGDVEMTPAFPVGMPPTGLKPTRTLQPKAVVGGPGFVSIARKPEEPEEAKKKEKKLERNRDSARESRKKQQSYVETLENGIKRLQINRDLVRSYRWGSAGLNRVEVVTGRTEAFASIQNPANFQSLMRLNRQRRTLAMQLGERERAVWKCFVFVGRQLAAMRTRVLQVQMLRTFSENPLAMELDALLNLTADQKLQLQCHAQQMFNEEVVELTKLFKIFFALRNEALRLNMMSPTLERYFREACSFDQLQKLLQWTENHRTVIETDLSLDEV
ncbi:Basic-leucine zipper domain [Phytophthora cactorum]|nr:Basic-leucine zipper domain [Phytophthora cactorum]